MTQDQLEQLIEDILAEQPGREMVQERFFELLPDNVSLADVLNAVAGLERAGRLTWDDASGMIRGRADD